MLNGACLGVMGAPAFHPVVLLKIVLLGYSRGGVSSHSIAAACANNVLFMAVSGGSCPDCVFHPKCATDSGANPPLEGGLPVSMGRH